MAQMTSINFHQTFKPEKQYIAGILELAEDSSFKTVKEISSLTGIPTGASSGKVEPHIFYANYMGLIHYEKQEGAYSLHRTSLGECVYSEDPGLQEDLTILLCHCMMQRVINGASVWSYIFNKYYKRIKKDVERLDAVSVRESETIPYLINEVGIKKEILLKELNVPFEGKVTQKNIAPFYGAYDTFFSSMELLDNDGDIIRLKALSYNKEFIYLYAFILFQYWYEKYPKQDEITSNQLAELCFGKVFGWDMQSEYEVLEHLADHEIIRMNRQLMPYTILQLVTAEELESKLYSELC